MRNPLAVLSQLDEIYCERLKYLRGGNIPNLLVSMKEETDMVNFMGLNWDIRGLLSALDPLSKLYVCLLLIASSLTLAAAVFVQKTILFSGKAGRPKPNSRHLKILKVCLRNLQKFSQLLLILFAASAFTELAFGLRAFELLRLNPNMDTIGPFDGLAGLSAISFLLLGFISMTQWLLGEQLLNSSFATGRPSALD